MDEIERWLPAIEFEGSYEVSSFGRVRSIGRLDTMGRRLHTRVMTNARLAGRYMRIRLRRDGNAERMVHLMVLEAFAGSRPAGMVACHWDGDTRNNRLGNLRWDTPSNNQRDKIRHGTMASGSRNGWAKLTAYQVVQIRAQAAAGCNAAAIGRLFGLSATHVRRVVRGESWGHLAVAVTWADQHR